MEEWIADIQQDSDTGTFPMENAHRKSPGCLQRPSHALQWSMHLQTPKTTAPEMAASASTPTQRDRPTPMSASSTPTKRPQACERCWKRKQKVCPHNSVPVSTAHGEAN